MVETKMIRWIKNNRFEALLFTVILLSTVFLRFYRLPEYMTFLGDEGRDAIIIKKILTEQDIPFVGPPTSVGNMYLGPLYYYMMAISMSILWLNPAAAAGMVAILGTATVALIYYLARQWFGLNAAIVSSVLYAISPVNIIQSHSSWNPNPAPFFSLLVIFGLYKSRQCNDYRWLVLTGAASAAAIQMHYLALVLLPIIVLLWVFDFASKGSKKHLFIGSILGVVVFLLITLPLILFDFKHNFLNYRNFILLFSGDQENALGFNIFSLLQKGLFIYSSNLVGRYIAGSHTVLTLLISALVALPLVQFVRQRLISKQVNWPLLVLSGWLMIGILGLSFYRYPIYDHYLGFLNPAPYLLLGALIVTFKRNLRFYISLGLILVLGFVALKASPLQYPPNNQLGRTQAVARSIIEQAEGKPFNFALIAQNNYDAAYQFYLDIYGYNPKVLPIEITDQLFVVCEDPVCSPINHPKYEIAAFGWAKIADTFETHGVKIYKLIANPEGKPS